MFIPLLHIMPITNQNVHTLLAQSMTQKCLYSQWTHTNRELHVYVFELLFAFFNPEGHVVEFDFFM